MNPTDIDPPPPSSVRPYTVVVGIEFDETGEAAWGEAHRIGRQGHPNVMIHLVHVIPDPSVVVEVDACSVVSPIVVRDIIDRLQVFALDKMGTASHPFGDRVHLHIGCGRVAKVLIQFAVDANADAIIVGAHRRTTDGEVRLGPVALELIKEAPCSVLVIRPKDYAGMPASRGIVQADPFPVRDVLSYRRLSWAPDRLGEPIRSMGR